MHQINSNRENNMDKKLEKGRRNMLAQITKGVLASLGAVIIAMEKVERVIHRLIENAKISKEEGRRVMEELGPTFIKFGQIISLRPDLIPKKKVFQTNNFLTH
jgi:predicted unusual protein kinase regulating ubiquinone biosynthesis (AarF/ABC1/UbiB family)